MALGTRLYMGGIKYNVERIDIKQFFCAHRELTELTFKQVTGTFGYGYVDFDTQETADSAVNRLNGRNLMGRRITLEYVSRNPIPGLGEFDSRSEYRLKLTNLATTLTWQELDLLMMNAGQTTYVDIHNPVECEGYVDFATEEMMMNAIRMYHKTIRVEGRRMRVRVDRRRSKEWGDLVDLPNKSSGELLDTSVSSDGSAVEIPAASLLEAEQNVEFLMEFFIQNGIDAAPVKKVKKALDDAVYLNFTAVSEGRLADLLEQPGYLTTDYNL
uniref:RRM domain-containing protein n=1 Tax=Strigamia maritima TaxID=126957 RepID=T1JEB3_STRMM